MSGSPQGNIELIGTIEHHGGAILKIYIKGDDSSKSSSRKKVCYGGNWDHPPHLFIVGATTFSPSSHDKCGTGVVFVKFDDDGSRRIWERTSHDSGNDIWKKLPAKAHLDLTTSVVGDDLNTEGLNSSSALADVSAMHSKTLQYSEGLNSSSALADVSAMHSKTLQYSDVLLRGLPGPHSDFMDVVRSGMNMYFRAISDKVSDDAQARNSLQIHEKHRHTGSWIDPITGEKTVFCHLGRLNEVDFTREVSVDFAMSLGHQCLRATVAHYDEENGEQTVWRRTDSDDGGDTWQRVSDDGDIKSADSVQSEHGAASDTDSVRGNYQPSSPAWAAVFGTDAEHGGDISEVVNELRL